MEKVAEKQQVSNLVPRPPIVVVMGHIDHGKTTLLDYIRKTSVAEKEVGGITQAIGAYQVTVRPSGEPSSRAGRGAPEILSPAATGAQDDFANRRITFIDTPGHEAFAGMRRRGTRVADIAVLVVAADEGVKPQTEEAIGIIREADLPFVVAVTKTDRPNADPARVKQQLAEREVLVEGFGGTVPVVELSAKTGSGVDALLETILLVAELEELSSDPAKEGEGVVIESHLDPKRGTTATLLVEDGTVRRGSFVAVGDQVCPVRIFENFRGEVVDRAGPSEPIRIVGFECVPALGEVFRAFPERSSAEAYAAQQRAGEFSGGSLTAPSGEGGQHVVNIVLKADVLGSLEALGEAVAKIGSPELSNHVLKAEVGDITESDVKLAAASANSFIIGFKVRAAPAIKELAERNRVTIVGGEIIYELLGEARSTMLALAPAEVKRRDLGRAKILALFREERGRQIVGGRVSEGGIRPGARFDTVRNGLGIGGGRILELQSGRRPAEEVNAGNEFGALAEADPAIAVGDELAIFIEETVKPQL